MAEWKKASYANNATTGSLQHVLGQCSLLASLLMGCWEDVEGHARLVDGGIKLKTRNDQSSKSACQVIAKP